MSPIYIFLRVLLKEVRQQDEEHLAQMAKSLNSYHFVREFRTIRLGLPRRTGKTTALIELAQDPAERLHVITKSVKPLKDLENEGLSVSTIASTPKPFLEGLSVLVFDESFEWSDNDKQLAASHAAEAYERSLDRSRFVALHLGT